MQLDTELEKNFDGYFIKTKLSVSEIAEILNNLPSGELRDLCFHLNDLTSEMIVDELYRCPSPKDLVEYFENTYEPDWKEVFDKVDSETVKTLKDFLKDYD